MKAIMTSLLILTLFSKTFGQETTSLIGKWKTIEVNAENFSITRNDSIVFPEKWKPRNKIYLQDRSAHLRTTYSDNIFIFTREGNFQLYRNENPRTIIFDGKFETQTENKILFNVKNIAKIDMETTAEYYFKNGELYLKMYAENNGPINYILTKVDN